MMAMTTTIRWLPRTLNLYIARAYLLNLLFMLGGLLGIIYIFDTVELVRRASKYEEVPLALVMQMGLLKLPDVGQVLLPFAVLFSAMFTFWQLNRRSELVVMRSAGFSVWQFLAPVIAVGVMAGIFYLSILNPLGAAMLSRYERLNDTYLTRSSSSVTVLREGIWLRQADADGYKIIRAGRINLAEWVLQDITVFFLGPNDDFRQRIDAPRARLTQGAWEFEDAVLNKAGAQVERHPLMSIPTTLTAQEIEESFASARTVSFWMLPGFIKTMEDTGFDATGLRIHFQTLMAMPLMFAAMILLAAAVSLRPPRFRGALLMVIAGIAMGFVVFFTSSFLQALGSSHQIPVMPASWAPAVVAFLFGVGIIMNLEDG